jgi:hypothetical protein
LNVADGALQLKVGETVNGAVVGARHVHAGQSVSLATAQTWRVGATRLRVRLASEPLAPEQPLARHLIESTATPLVPMWRNVLPILLVSLMLMLFEQWLDNDPGTPPNAYLSIVLLTLGATLAWALFFKAHLRLALLYGLTWTVLESALPLLAYVTGWPTLSRVSDVACAGVLCALVWAHLSLILPAHRIGLMAGVAALYLGGVGLHVWFNEQRTGQMFSERYATALPPPQWRLAGTQPVSALIDDAKGLKAKLDQQAKDTAADEGADLLSDD